MGCLVRSDWSASACHSLSQSMVGRSFGYRSALASGVLTATAEVFKLYHTPDLDAFRQKVVTLPLGANPV